MNVKNWIPISVIAIFVLGFVAWFASDYVKHPLVLQICAFVGIGIFAILGIVGFFSQSKK